PCADMPAPATATSDERHVAWTPIFESVPPLKSSVFLTQAALVARCVHERWRVLMLLSVPLLPDGGSGPYVAPTANDAHGWVAQFDGAVKGLPGAPTIGDTEDVSCATLYWPWVVSQEMVDAPLRDMPPSPFAAAIIARRDLARGPQLSPANETLREVVAVRARLTDAIHGPLYEPDPDAAGFAVPAINVVRPFPGYGIQVWGARTLSTEAWLRFIAVRRTLTAIELRMKAALDQLMFEPTTPAL